MGPSPKNNEDLKFLKCENANKNKKMALHSITTRNKYLKQPLC